ncbi:MAG: hypothetical protein K6A43_01620 [Treponema sp.]|nr:hypothetical protein [Treponema sp.]
MSNTNSNIEDKLKTVISKSAEVSKDVFKKTGNAVQNFSDKSVLKFEIKQLTSKRNKLYSELGTKLSEFLSAETINLNDTAASISQNPNAASAVQVLTDTQKQIEDLTALIVSKQAALKQKKDQKDQS